MFNNLVYFHRNKIDVTLLITHFSRQFCEDDRDRKKKRDSCDRREIEIDCCLKRECNIYMFTIIFRKCNIYFVTEEVVDIMDFKIFFLI